MINVKEIKGMNAVGKVVNGTVIITVVHEGKGYRVSRSLQHKATVVVEQQPTVQVQASPQQDLFIWKALFR